MKTSKLFFLLLLLQSSVFAQMNRYDYKRRLEGITEKNWYTIRLDADVLSRTSLSLEDVRIYRLSNSDTVETPYVLESLEATLEKNELAFEVINKSYDKQNGWQYITLKQTQPRTVNRIELEFSEKNFDWIVDIEGSTDQEKWLMVAENQRIVSLDNDFVEYRYTTLNFPSSDYRYFRLTIQSSAKPINLQHAGVYEYTKNAGSYFEVPEVQFKKEENKKNRTTILTGEFKKPYAINEIRLDVDSRKDFYRRVRTYYLRDVIKTESGEIENWVDIGGFVASSVEPVVYDFSTVRTNKIKLEIANRDDQPLNVTSIHAFGHYYQLKAELEPGADYFLVYGKKNETAPQYDVVYFKDKIPAQLKAVTVGEEWQMEKPVELKQKPLFESQWWLWAIMIMVILLLGGYSIHMLKGMKKN